MVNRKGARHAVVLYNSGLSKPYYSALLWKVCYTGFVGTRHNSEGTSIFYLLKLSDPWAGGVLRNSCQGIDRTWAGWQGCRPTRRLSVCTPAIARRIYHFFFVFPKTWIALRSFTNT